MADWPLFDGGRYATVGTIDSSRGGTVYSANSANTKGSWNEIATVPFHANEITLGIYANGPSGGLEVMVDMAKGTVGSQVIVVNNIGYYHDDTTGYCFHFPIPIEVNSGEVLSFRAQSNSATPQLTQITSTFAQKDYSHTPGSQIYTYGANTSNTTGTQVVCGFPNVKGAWAQLTPSTSVTTKKIILLTCGHPAPGFNNEEYLYDVGIGPAGAEKIKLSDLRFRGLSAQSYIHPPMFGPLPCVIPAGSRIAMRGQTNGGGRNTSFILYAFN